MSEREYQRGDEIVWYPDADKMVRNEYNPLTAYAFGIEINLLPEIISIYCSLIIDLVASVCSMNVLPYLLMPDKVFGPQSTTPEVYDVAAKPVVKAAMEGVNGTVFAYGVTSSGKTHTMHVSVLEKYTLYTISLYNVYCDVKDIRYHTHTG
jgi:centromeric protein E